MPWRLKTRKAQLIHTAVLTPLLDFSMGGKCNIRQGGCMRDRDGIVGGGRHACEIWFNVLIAFSWLLHLVGSFPSSSRLSRRRGIGKGFIVVLQCTTSRDNYLASPDLQPSQIEITTVNRFIKANRNNVSIKSVYMS